MLSLWFFPDAKLRHASARLRAAAFAGLVCALLGLFAAPRAVAQGQTAGSVIGTVTDSLGAVIPDATVALTSTERGDMRVVISNESGQYVFNQVPVGTYTLSVNATSFAVYQSTNITVDANQSTRVNPLLNAAEVTTSVTVSDNSSDMIDTTSATIGQLVDNRLVENLPIDGGNTVALAALLPGVVNMNAPTTFTAERTGPTYNVSGSRNTQNLMLLDGSMWNNLFYNTGLNYPPRQGLQEVSVLLNNYKAQYGRNAGSIFNVVTASGSNQFHGKLWEYAENSAFNAADYITQQNPRLVQNQFGATVGGPIVKNKLFFMGTFQNIRLAETATGHAEVQSYAQRGLTPEGGLLPCTTNGAFAGQNCASFIQDANGKTNFLKNPLYNSSTAPIAQQAFSTAYQVASGQTATGQGTSPCYQELLQVYNADGEYIPNSEIPSVCFNPVIVNVLNKYVPLPTAANTNATGTYTYAPYPRYEYNGLMRVDFVRGSHTIDARYFISDNSDIESQSVSSTTGVGLSNYELMANSGGNTFGNIGDTWVISPTALNVFRIGYKRYVNTNVPTDPTTLDNLGGQMQAFGMPTLPQFNFNLYNAGNQNEGYTHIVNEDIEGDDSLSWTHHKHNLEVGASWLRLQYQNETQYAGYIQFSSTFTGDVYADSMMGLVNSLRVANEENLAGIEHEIFAYAQDDWRVTNRLTLNLGLRYELPFVWDQPKGQSSTFIPGFQSTVFPNAPAGYAFVGDKGIPRSLVNTDFLGLAPRLGLAYNLNGSSTHPLVLRTGAGLFFDAINANVVGVGEPFYDRFQYATPNGGTSDPLLGLPAVPLYYDSKNPQFVGPFSMYFPDKNFKTPYVMAANFGFQQALTQHATLEVDYVGKLARHLTMPYDQNPAIYDCSGTYYQISPTTYCPSLNTGETSASYTARVKYPNFNYGGQGLVDFASIATSSYNGLQAMVNQRAGHGLTLIATYTYSRSIDQDTDGQNDNNEVPNVFNLKSERGPSDYNVTQNFTAGWVYFTPKIRFGDRAVHAIFDDWQINGTLQRRTGMPFNMTINDDHSLSDEPNQRPIILPGVSPYLSTSRSKAQLIQEYFNTAAFAYPAVGTFSTLGRNAFVGPGYFYTNLTVGRTFPLGFREGTSLAFRADAFNVFNNVNLNNPNGEFSCSSSTPEVACTDPTATSQFGQILNTASTNSALTSSGRKLQLSLTLSY
jgi:Carboxypeptidase regulatory-like domain/TonB dependent receptor